MTFRDKQFALLADLAKEKMEFGPLLDCYYDRKIAEMREAIYGSGSGFEAGGSTSMQDVSGGAPQVVREGGDADSTVSV